MKHFSYHFLLLSAFVLQLCISCTKKDDTAPLAPTTGTLSGVVKPIGSIASITATASGGQLLTLIPNAATGAFSLKNLAPDTYSFNFSATTGFVAPAGQTAAVIAGRNTALDTVRTALDTVRVVQPPLSGVPRGTVTLFIKDTTYTSTSVGGFIPLVGDTFTLNARFVHGNAEERFDLMKPNFRGMGTHILDLLDGYSEANVIRYRNNRPLVNYRNYHYSQPLSSFQITTYNPATRTIAGTFSLNMLIFIAPGPYVPATGTFNLQF